MNVGEMLIVNFIERFESMSRVLSGPKRALMTDALMTSPAINGESFSFVDGASVSTGNGRFLDASGIPTASLELQRVQLLRHIFRPTTID